MNKLPWMKYDPDIISLDVDGMSLEEEGAYSRAVRHIWRVGPLPEERLLKLCGNALEAVILCMEEREGLWSFDWLEQARGSAKAWQEQRSLAGKKSAEKRTTVQRPFNDRSTVVLSPSISLSHSLSSYESLSENSGKGTRAKVEVDPRFEALWKTFEGKGAKSKSREYWHRLTEEDREAIIAKAPEYCAVNSGERLTYRKNLEGWINPAERRWEAPIIRAKSSPMQAALHSADVPPDAYSEQ